MISRPLTKSEVAEIPLGMCWAPQFMNRSERRKLNRKNPNLQKLFASMAAAKTMDVADLENKQNMEDTIIGDPING